MLLYAIRLQAAVNDISDETFQTATFIAIQVGSLLGMSVASRNIKNLPMKGLA